MASKRAEESLDVPCLDLVTRMIYDLGMINSIDPMAQLALGWLAVALIGALLSAIGIALTRASDRKESMPQLAADLDKSKTPTIQLYAPHIPPRPRLPRD